MVDIVTTVNNIFPGFLPPATDPIAIYDQSYVRVFREGKILDVNIKESSRSMEHPVENGIIITDHRIILPVDIEISFLLNSTNYVSVYQQIKENFISATLYTIQTRTGVYENQMIVSMPHVEDETVYNGIVVNLNFRQVLIVTATVAYSPANVKDSDTVNRGTQQGSSANATQTAKATSGLFKVS
jgi:hypothetical protein